MFAHLFDVFSLNFSQLEIGRLNRLREICARNQRESQDAEPRRLRLEVLRLRQQQYRVKEAEDALKVRFLLSQKENQEYAQESNKRCFSDLNLNLKMRLLGFFCRTDARAHH